MAIRETGGVLRSRCVGLTGQSVGEKEPLSVRVALEDSSELYTDGLSRVWMGGDILLDGSFDRNRCSVWDADRAQS